MVEDNGLGNGSILMNYFFKYCKSCRPVVISGYFSSCDKDHFDTVTFNEDRTSGSIKLKL